MRLLELGEILFNSQKYVATVLEWTLTKQSLHAVTITPKMYMVLSSTNNLTYFSLIFLSCRRMMIQTLTSRVADLMLFSYRPLGVVRATRNLTSTSLSIFFQTSTRLFKKL
jgi:hypothetical protein